MYKVLFAASVCFASSLVYSKLPQDSQALANYANQLNAPNPTYRPFQVITNHQTVNTSGSTRSSGFTTRYLGVSYSKNKSHENETQVLNQNQKEAFQNQSVRPAQTQQNVRPVIRPASHTYSQTQYANNYDQIVLGRIATINCVAHAARAEGVPLYVLLGIHSKERGTNGQTAKNKNASIDMGHFQINTIHFKRGGMFENYDKNHANNDGCLNARLAAKILRNRLNTNTSKDFWTRAAAYHSWTPHYNNIYKNGTHKQPGLISYSNQWKSWLQKQGVNPN